jgi:O-antigen/teichoic acid export membrane protein
MIATGLGVTATGVALPALRAGERFRGYLTVMVASALTSAGAAAIFVLVLKTGVLGALSAGIVANAVVLAVALRVVPWRRSVKTDKTLIRRSLRMGIPLVPHFASMQALVLADRLLLVGLVSASALGLYGLASNIALPAMIACQAITTATMPTYARVGTSQGEAGRRALRQMVTMQVAAITLVTTATALLGPPLIGILASKEFANAAPLVAWVALGFGFLGLYGIPMNGATIGAGRTNRAWIATMTGAASNIVLILVLTPRIGIEGAAIASAGGYFVLLLGIGFWAHAGPNPVSYDLPRVVGIIALAIAAYAGAVFVNLGGDVASLIVRSAFLLVLLAGITLVTGVSGHIVSAVAARRSSASSEDT